MIKLTSQFLSHDLCYGHAIFTGSTSLGYKTDFNFDNIIATLSFYFFSKKFTSKCHQVPGAIFNLVSLIDVTVSGQRR